METSNMVGGVWRMGRRRAAVDRVGGVGRRGMAARFIAEFIADSISSYTHMVHGE